MSQIPPYPGETPPTGPFYQAPSMYTPPPRTSGFAISSLIVGILGLPTCCLPVFGLLAVVFGFIALPGIRRQEATGRGMAIAGILLGILSLLLSVAFWVVVAVSPKWMVLSKQLVQPPQLADLRSIGVLNAGESIDTLALANAASVREGGVALTDQRLVVFDSSGPTQQCRLKDIKNLNYSSSFSSASYEVILKNGKSFSFQIKGMQLMTGQFRQVLQQRIDQLRQEPEGDERSETEAAEEEATDEGRP